ncbi:DUF4435 domain-containing protein [Pantoea sp. Al-1710]|uniref:DUF4435 domain-containing protein n=1 Tax=Candidatus Pantoea communis TaxID=2608354 RepID=A0ABX0RUN7_9GAMM|nr:DUF4435 domain-containing protein [Pantoea communis]NIG21307.1 DUF4435 domain-containing protein [Pantoea communis]
MSSLRDAIGEEDWMSTMLMAMRNGMNRDRILVVVEGITDISFFNTHRLDDRILYDSPESGKSEVIRAVSTLRSAGNDAVYGVCDADFDRLSNISHEGIYFTDAHDLEMMLVEGGVVDKFIMHFAQRRLTNGALAIPFCQKIKQSVLLASYRLGLLKWFNYLDRAGLNFKGMRYPDFISVNGTDVAVDEMAYISHILDRSRGRHTPLSGADLLNEMRRLEMMSPDKYAICNGHDFVYLLKMLFDTPVSVRNSMRLDEIDSYMRMSYDRQIFSATQLHSSLTSLLVRH